MKIIAIVSFLVSTSISLPIIEENLLKNSIENGPLNIFISFQPARKIIDQLKTQNFQTNSQKRKLIFNALKTHSTSAQQTLTNFLESSNIEFRSYWLTNELYIPNCPHEALTQIMSNFPQVSSIREESFALLESTFDSLSFAKPKAPEWGILNVEAPAAWDQDFYGAGVKIGILDTGVLGSHESLVSSKTEGFSWFDPSGKTLEPNDSNGHGTHVAGIICGSPDIGVAPQATWMACKGCRTSSCSEADLKSCAQFFACPHDPNEENQDCDQAPHVISNSWGIPRGAAWFEEVVEKWRDLGIIPVFAAGDDGPLCSTSTSPGDSFKAISIGSIAQGNVLSTFSSVGPPFERTENETKPDFVAPGSSVRSAYILSDDSYAIFSGTSMACPHVSGVIALLMSKNMSIGYDEIYNALDKGAFKNVKPTNRNCGGVPDSHSYPNNNVGHGSVSVKSSLTYI